MDELSRLEHLYLKQFKKKLPIELFVSCDGNREPGFGLTAYYLPEQRADLQFLIEAAKTL